MAGYMEYFYTRNGQQVGPVPINQLVHHQLQRDTYVWAEGMPDWQKAGDVPGLQFLFQAAPGQQAPPPPPASNYRPADMGQFARTATGMPMYTTYWKVDHFPSPQQIDRKFRMWQVMYWLNIAIMVLGLIVMIILIEERWRDEEIGLYFMGLMVAWLPLYITAKVFRLQLLSLAWKLIHDPQFAPRNSPDKAVGLLFVPIFNIYWNFEAYKGFMEDANRYMDLKGIHGLRADVQFANVYCMLFIFLIIPYLGWIMLLALWVMKPILISRLKNTLLHILTQRTMMGI